MACPGCLVAVAGTDGLGQSDAPLSPIATFAIGAVLGIGGAYLVIRSMRHVPYHETTGYRRKRSKRRRYHRNCTGGADCGCGCKE